MNNRELEKMNKVVTGGMPRFVLLQGVIGWALVAAILFYPAMGLMTLLANRAEEPPLWKSDQMIREKSMGCWT